MKTLRIMLLAVAMFQEPQAPQPAPQQPAPAPAPQAPQQQPAYDADAVRRQQEQERMRQQQIEYERRRQEEERRKNYELLFGDKRPTLPPPILKPFVAPLMQHDSTFDLKSIPLAEWLSGPDMAQIPWKVDIKDADLRMDQRVEVAFSATVQAKDLSKLGKVHDFYFVTFISDVQQRFFAGPKVVHHSMKNGIPKQAELRFTDWVLTQPGDYVLSLVLYDRNLAKHNVIKRTVHVGPLENDPLPLASSKLPALEIPPLSDREGYSVLDFYEGLVLPVRNKSPLDVQLISVMSPPEQWTGRTAIAKIHNQKTASAMTALSQVRLAQGTVSATGLDVSHRAVPFQQASFERLNWKGLAEALGKIQSQTVSFQTLADKGGSVFFRESMSKQLAKPGTAKRVFIVVSSSLVFVRGSDMQPLKVEGDCNCRVYHLRFKHNIDDLFDDIERLLKPLQPKTFTLTTPRDMRKALAEIIQDLEGL